MKLYALELDLTQFFLFKMLGKFSPAISDLSLQLRWPNPNTLSIYVPVSC